MQNFGNGTVNDPCDVGDRNTKKVHFKEAVGVEETNMVVDSEEQLMMSFKDKLLGGGMSSSDRNLVGNLRRNEGDLEILDGDVNTSMVNGIPAIAFSERIKDILFKKMESTVILKLLGCSICYNFAHLAVFVNLEKPLTSKVLVDGDIQRVEYESLPTACFICGRYGHVKELCPSIGVGAILERPEVVLERTEATAVMTSGDIVGECGKRKNAGFGPWMLVERKSRRGLWDSRVNGVVKIRKDLLGSRFTLLIRGMTQAVALLKLMGVMREGKKEVAGL
ncbi:hypothetical protein J1N35_040218 [Gossypium stocksii]|uniref:CCHC-type domain-containing protein n=1 Tax=Gossypium stocksii TaxID=47602 RepID=A0A9D3UD96_9ROSI|nr:hypothetical protein J1N35_040218 [Gossypium stocksii]